MLRSTTFIGVCVEFVAAVAWLAELFDDHDQRERALGYTQAFSSFGGLLVAVVFGFCNEHAKTFPARRAARFPCRSWAAIADAHAAWRYTLISGLIPAIPLIVIRPFLPESPTWAAKKAAGTLRRPRLSEIFAPAVAADDDRHHDHVRVQLRRRVRRDPANAANRQAVYRRPGEEAEQAEPADALKSTGRPPPITAKSRRSADWSGDSCSPFSPCGFSAAAR